MGKVISVSDGDTITLLHDRKAVRIRLAEIDAPEKKQPFGTRSREYLKSRIHGKKVAASCSKHDRYQRKLCFIYDEKRVLINLEMVEQGLAWAYKDYVTLPKILEAQERAKKERKGLWADKNPEPPWEWRRKHSRQKKVRLSFE